MSEPPDFDAIALRLVSQSTALAQVAIVEQLRQVWNARGAADREAMEAPFMGLGPFYEKVTDAIKALDR